MTRRRIGSCNPSPWHIFPFSLWKKRKCPWTHQPTRSWLMDISSFLRGRNVDGRNSVHPTTDHTNEKRFSFVVGLWCFLFSLPEEEKRKGRSSIDRSIAHERSIPAPGQTFPRRKGRNVVQRSWIGAGMSRQTSAAGHDAVRLTPRPGSGERFARCQLSTTM